MGSDGTAPALSLSEPGRDLWESHPREFEQLFHVVQKHMTRSELRSMLSRREVLDLDPFHTARIEFIASPQSVRIQRQEHTDWVPKLVNEKTLAQGLLFFEKHQEIFRLTHERTGVKPQDIIAILNWESRLGEYRGEYDVMRIFAGQIFLLDEVERRHFANGAYEAEGAMARPDALKRIERIKKRAVNNLGELLIQSKRRGFDPYLVKGSWAGAIGIPQFMPASMIYAVDGDGDGVVDLNTEGDAIMSVGNYLARNGYHGKGSAFAFKRYNPDGEYVRGVALYSEGVEKLGVNPAPHWIYRGGK